MMVIVVVGGGWWVVVVVTVLPLSVPTAPVSAAVLGYLTAPPGIPSGWALIL
jgi:hypothetical protein